MVDDAPRIEDGTALVEAWFGVWAEVVCSLVLEAQALAGRAPGEEDLEPRTRRWYEAGLARAASEHLRDLRTIQLGARAVAELLERCDVWLTPTLSRPAIPLGAFDAEAADAVSAPYMAFSPYTRVANMTGCPAMSVPLHWTPEGLPVGAHFMGRMWDEATLIGLAAQLEQAAPWRDRRPPVRV